MAKLSEHLHGGVVTGKDIQRVRDTLLFEQPERQRKIFRFLCLLILAAAISTFGLLADSIATVIGAMIVAPLMLPIMGLAFGVSLADRGIILNSLLISILGIVTAIAIGFLLTWAFRNVINPEANTQIMLRTAPRLVDLCAALATGLAGAFATGRRDISDTLPGVAIAISLVPPLTNVGILLATGRPDLAVGSLLLFVTNYLAILLMGSLVFALMAYPRAYRALRSHSARRTTIFVAFVLLTFVVIPLSATSFKTVQNTVAEQRAAVITKDWLAGSDYRLVSASAGTDTVRIVIIGQGDLPSQQDLKAALRGELFDLPVDLEVVPQTRIRFETVQPAAK